MNLRFMSKIWEWLWSYDETNVNKGIEAESAFVKEEKMDSGNRSLEVKLFVCEFCGTCIQNGHSIHFMWDKHFCSNSCRMSFFDTKCPPDVTATANKLAVPSAWVEPKSPVDRQKW